MPKLARKVFHTVRFDAHALCQSLVEVSFLCTGYSDHEGLGSDEDFKLATTLLLARAIPRVDGCGMLARVSPV